MKLTNAQRRHLVALAAIRDDGATGEAYFYPVGPERKMARMLDRLGCLESADAGRGSVYRLTDIGYQLARKGGP